MGELKIDMRIPPQWERLDTVRRATELAVGSVHEGGDANAVAERIAIITTELLENAVKYGTPSAVRLEIRRVDDRIVVAVTNELADPHDEERLRSRMAWLESFPTPLEAYCASMEALAADESSGSGLGLARVMYEGECRLRCDSMRPGQLTVEATTECPSTDPEET